MASKKKARPKTTRWRPSTWERQYRGLALWVEEMFSAAPKWSWQTQDGGEGRAVSRTAAMRAAERAVDADMKSKAGA